MSAYPDNRLPRITTSFLPAPPVDLDEYEDEEYTFVFSTAMMHSVWISAFLLCVWEFFARRYFASHLLACHRYFWPYILVCSWFQSYLCVREKQFHSKGVTHIGFIVFGIAPITFIHAYRRRPALVCVNGIVLICLTLTAMCNKRVFPRSTPMCPPLHFFPWTPLLQVIVLTPSLFPSLLSMTSTTTSWWRHGVVDVWSTTIILLFMLHERITVCLCEAFHVGGNGALVPGPRTFQVIFMTWGLWRSAVSS
eukprot:PhF_6_TR22209/c0_g1_i1/m.31355